MKYLLYALFVLAIQNVSAQLHEDFEWEHLEEHPQWTGDRNLWEVSEGQLHSLLELNTGDPQAQFYLSTQHHTEGATLWEFWVKLGINPSSKNYINLFLNASQEYPGEENNHGYFVRIGGTEDQISLFRKDANTTTPLIESRLGITNFSTSTFKIKVIRTADHRWGLFTDESGIGDHYFFEGQAFDSTYVEGNYFTIQVYQSGKTASKKHWFDDIDIQAFDPSSSVPKFHSYIIKSENQIALTFSETQAESLLSEQNYLLNTTLSPSAVIPSPENPNEVILEFDHPFSQGQSYELALAGITNWLDQELDSSFSFTYYQPQAYDVVFHEVFPDPNPSLGLPEQEFIEILNTSPYSIQLKDWELCDPVRCATFPKASIKPNELLLLTDSKNETLFSAFGQTVGLDRIPTLNNDGDDLILKDNKGNPIHTLSYSKKDYQDQAKESGGWTIEMKYPQHPCLVEGNWAASTASLGGTPGAPNSGADDHQNTPFLGLNYVEVKEPNLIVAHFNAGLDKNVLDKSHFEIGPHEINHIEFVDSSYTQIKITLEKPLEERIVYYLKVKELTACGLLLGVNRERRFGISEPSSAEELWISELLFNPPERGAEFIEIYNSSFKIIDLQSLLLANRDKNGNIAAFQPLSTSSFYLFPQEFVVITKDPMSILNHYFVKYPSHLKEVEKLPSYPNTDGNVILLDTALSILDEVNYYEQLQYALLHNRKGIALEKIHLTGDSNNPDNWASASSIAGYATPTYQNSQFSESMDPEIRFQVTPKTFSPDGNGLDDDTYLRYELPPDYSGTIRIYNEKGRLVRVLASHRSLGTKDAVRWDGKADYGRQLPTGIYIFHIQLYHPNGKTKNIKLPVILVSGR